MRQIDKSTNLTCYFFSTRMNNVSSCVNTGANHRPCLNIFRHIPFMCHSDTVRKRKKKLHNKIITYNQSMNNALTKQYDEILCSILNNHTSISLMVQPGSGLGEKQKEASRAEVA